MGKDTDTVTLPRELVERCVKNAERVAYIFEDYNAPLCEAACVDITQLRAALEEQK